VVARCERITETLIKRSSMKTGGRKSDRERLELWESSGREKR
jgi:hypothetical protein